MPNPCGSRGCLTYQPHVSPLGESIAAPWIGDPMQLGEMRPSFNAPSTLSRFTLDSKVCREVLHSAFPRVR